LSVGIEHPDDLVADPRAGIIAGGVTPVARLFTPSTTEVG